MVLNDIDTINGYKTLLLVATVATQTLFVFTGDLSSFPLYVSYMTSFPIAFCILLWLDINADSIVVERHLKPFPLTATQSLLISWNYLLFKKGYLLYIILVYSSLFLVPNTSKGSSVLYFVWSILQTTLVLLAMVVLYNFLAKRGLSKHLLTVPALSVLLSSLLPDSHQVYLLINPFSVGCAAVGYLNLEGFFANISASLLVFSLLSLLLVALYNLPSWK